MTNKRFRTNQTKGVQGEHIAAALLASRPELVVYAALHFGSGDDGGVDLIVRNTETGDLYTVSVKTQCFEKRKNGDIVINRAHFSELDKDTNHRFFLGKQHVVFVLGRIDCDEERAKYLSLGCNNVGIHAFIPILFNGVDLDWLVKNGYADQEKVKTTGATRYKLEFRIKEEGGSLYIGYPNNPYKVGPGFFRNYAVFNDDYMSALGLDDC